MTICACGCGLPVILRPIKNPYQKRKLGFRYRPGHWNRGRKHTEEHKRAAARPMELNGRWKGGRAVDSDGYVLIKRPDHPNANNNGYVREHRLVIEAAVGRYLEAHEEVHHVNGLKHDNRPDNLILFENHGAHQRHERTGKKFPRAKTQILSCARCGKEFHRQKSYGPATYCSWLCRYPNSIYAKRVRPR